ncbi:hypothetical protein [Caudoviricetes sp.]|nr:hypothetical protein [Caudoviricetes sp.]
MASLTGWPRDCGDALRFGCKSQSPDCFIFMR